MTLWPIASQNSPTFVPVLCTPSASASSAGWPGLFAVRFKLDPLSSHAPATDVRTAPVLKVSRSNIESTEE